MIDIWQEIYSTIKRNKLRTFLTGFAVAWGIFMLIVLLGAGNGLIHAFEQSASERAMNSIKIFPGWTSKSYDGLKEGRRVQLDNKDVDATNRYFPDHVINTGGTVWQGGVNLSFGQEYVSLSLSGVYPNHTEVEVVKLFKGRFINEIDIRERRKVIVLIRRLLKSYSTRPIPILSDSLSMPAMWFIKWLDFITTRETAETATPTFLSVLCKPFIIRVTN